MDALQLWFSFRGRASRAQYWLVVISNFVLMVAGIVLVAHAVAPASAEAGLIAMVIWAGVLIVSSLAISAKRLRDFDFSAWWLVAMAAAFAAIGLVEGFLSIGGHAAPARLTTAVGNVLTLIVMLVLGSIPGTRGPNRFGPEPAALMHGSVGRHA
jgi:uncharacterized membrane protein YhaH (DUF805 family)